MSKEVRELIAQLEAERTRIVEEHELFEEAVRTRELAAEDAAMLERERLGGRTYHEAIAIKNQLIREAKDIVRAQWREINVKTTPAILAVLLVASVVWNWGGITGLFTVAPGQQFYRVDVGTTLTASQTIPLAADRSVTSVYVEGSATGTGSANVWLVHGNARFLAAQFTPQQSSGSALGGLVTADDLLITADADTTASTLDLPLLDGANETNESTDTTESSGAADTNGTNGTNATLPPTELPATPIIEDEIEDGPSAEPTLPAVSESQVVWDRECLETCQLPALDPPLSILVETTGDVHVTIDTIVYGSARAEPLSVIAGPAPADTEQPPVQSDEQPPGEETPVPISPNASNTTVNVTNQTVNQTANGSLTVPTPPDAPDVPPAQDGLGIGASCTQDAACASGSCAATLYQGIASSGVCVPDTTWCAASGESYPAGTTVGESVCLATAAKAVWLAAEGSGRFEIKDSANQTVAAIDRYGTLAVSGSAAFSAPAADEGWVVRDENGTSRLSIDEAGNLRAAGSLTTRTTPQATTGKDVIIQDRDGILRAVITENGNVSLAGDLATGVRFP